MCIHAWVLRTEILPTAVLPRLVTHQHKKPSEVKLPDLCTEDSLTNICATHALHWSMSTLLRVLSACLSTLLRGFSTSCECYLPGPSSEAPSRPPPPGLKHEGCATLSGTSYATFHRRTGYQVRSVFSLSIFVAHCRNLLVWDDGSFAVDLMKVRLVHDVIMNVSSFLIGLLVKQNSYFLMALRTSLNLVWEKGNFYLLLPLPDPTNCYQRVVSPSQGKRLCCTALLGVWHYEIIQSH